MISSLDDEIETDRNSSIVRFQEMIKINKFICDRWIIQII